MDWIYELNTSSGRSDEQLPCTVPGHGCPRSRRQEPTCRAACAHLPPASLSPRAAPAAPAASVAVWKIAQHPLAANARGFASSCRHWDEPGKGKRKTLYQDIRVGELGGLGRGWVSGDVQLGLVSLMGKGWGCSRARRGCLCSSWAA